MIATEANTNEAAERNSDRLATNERPEWQEPVRAFESGMEALCSLGVALGALHSLEHKLNNVLGPDSARPHREAVERAILDLAKGLGCQRDRVQLGYEPLD